MNIQVRATLDWIGASECRVLQDTSHGDVGSVEHA